MWKKVDTIHVLEDVDVEGFVEAGLGCSLEEMEICSSDDDEFDGISLNEVEVLFERENPSCTDRIVLCDSPEGAVVSWTITGTGGTVSNYFRRRK